MGAKRVVRSFDGEHSFLSNFHQCYFVFNDQMVPTVEHAYQAAKTLDDDEHEWVLEANTPNQAKRRGRQVTLREDWEEVKDFVMLDCLRLKFEDEVMRELLMRTRNALLIEGNTWHDRYWGRCVCHRCGTIGQNMLGKLLMQVRKEIKRGVRFDGPTVGRFAVKPHEARIGVRG